MSIFMDQQVEKHDRSLLNSLQGNLIYHDYNMSPGCYSTLLYYILTAYMIDKSEIRIAYIIISRFSGAVLNVPKDCVL